MCVSIPYMRNHRIVPLILSINFLCGIQTLAQNVGIGTTTPQARLDLVNSFRAGGLNNYFSYDSSGRINWSNSFMLCTICADIDQECKDQPGCPFTSQMIVQIFNE